VSAAAGIRLIPALSPAARIRDAVPAAVLDPTGAVTLTAPSPFTIGWEHLRIP